MTSRQSQESARPLLHDDGSSVADAASVGTDEEAQRQPERNRDASGRRLSAWQQRRRRAQGLLLSRRKHVVILGIVALDVLALLTNVFIELVTCEMGIKEEPWVEPTIEGLKIAGLVFSCLFLAELVLCVGAFGFAYFDSWFHCFDALIIVASFAIDLVAHGVAEDIASLVVVLRLTRLVKIVEEVSMGAAERMEGMEAEVEKLREENRVMGLRLARDRDGDAGS